MLSGDMVMNANLCTADAAWAAAKEAIKVVEKFATGQLKNL